MDQALFFLKKLNYEFGRLVSGMDGTTWAVFAFVALVVGMLILKGGNRGF